MDSADQTEKKIRGMKLEISELQCEQLSAHPPDPFNLLTEMSKKQRYGNMFDYHKSIIAELGEDRSFYTTDLADILWKYQQWQAELPKVKMFYAVKANPDPVLLRLLVLLGANFDCASEGEIRAVMSVGAGPDQIVFANPVITSSGLKYAKKTQISLMTFDTKEQLYKVCRIYPKARLLIRICPAEVECGFDFREKFGCKLEESYHLLKIAKELGLNVVGVSFHVGSLNNLMTAFATSVRDSREVFNYAQSLGFLFSILDIGGGFHGSIGTDALFQKTAQIIKESLSTHFPMNDVEVIAEPGCYVVCSAVTLTTTINAKKVVLDPTDGNSLDVKKLYFLNDSIYCSFSPANEQYGIFYEPLLSQQELAKRPRYNSCIFGQTLCSLDVIRRDIEFEDMRVGESLVWRNQGAYSRTLNTRFCGFEVPGSRYVFRKKFKLKSNWIKNLGEVIRHLSNFVYVIQDED